MAAPPQNALPAADGPHKVVYQRCITRQLRVLDAKIARLELQLNGEMEKVSSCSELLEEIIDKPLSSSCSALREELDKARAKREEVYQDFQRKHQQESQGSNDNGDGNAPPSAADAAAPPSAADAAAPPAAGAAMSE